MKKNLFSPTPSVVKRGTVTMLCLMLSGLFLVAGCKKDNPVISGGSGSSDGGEEPEYPINIPFMEYSLDESCHWTNLAYNDKVIIINSEEDLNRYVACMDDDYTEIDFSKYTMLLPHGYHTSGVNPNNNSLQQLSEQNYEMRVDLFPTYLTAVTYWQAPIIVDKLDEGCVIELLIVDKGIER